MKNPAEKAVRPTGGMDEKIGPLSESSPAGREKQTKRTTEARVLNHDNIYPISDRESSPRPMFFLRLTRVTAAPNRTTE